MESKEDLHGKDMTEREEEHGKVTGHGVLNECR